MKRFSTIYAVATQGVILLVVLAVGGYFLGRWIIPDSYILAGCLAALGVLVGVSVFIKMIITIGGDEDRKNL